MGYENRQYIFKVYCRFILRFSPNRAWVIIIPMGLVQGIKNGDGIAKGECRSCGSSMVRKFMGRRHDRLDVYAPKGQENKNANFLRILMTLRALRQRGDITEKEYRRAKKYYQNLTGADIVLTD